MSESNLILNHQKVLQKIDRIAYQIYEANHELSTITMAGIHENGYIFAQLLKAKLEEVSDLKVDLRRVEVNKKNPLQMCSIEGDDNFKNGSVVVVDDVLNSGRTMMYALQCFLNNAPEKLTVAVLINRSHKRFPVNANYVGLSLATTLKEHIEVSFENPESFKVTLS